MRVEGAFVGVCLVGEVFGSSLLFVILVLWDCRGGFGECAMFDDV